MQLLLPKVEFDMHWHENAFTKNDYATISITSITFSMLDRQHVMASIKT